VPVDERSLAEHLITYDTSDDEGLRVAAGFVKGWLESNAIDVFETTFGGLPVLTAEVGAASGPTVIFHGHLDVVPGYPEQFAPRVDGDRLIGRGAYDMKGGLAAMMCALVDVAAQDAVRVRFVCVPDEESEDVEDRSTDHLVRGGLTGDFAITGEPTDLHIGVQAKGVLACRVRVLGRSAHGSTPWLGDNAVLKAVDVFRRIESLPFARESSELFDRPSINLGRIKGGDRFNKVPDECLMDVDIRYLPGQGPEEILAQMAEIPDCEVVRTLTRAPAYVSRHNPYVRALVDAVGRSTAGESISVGRDGASDAVSFLEAGIPAVEFGPSGAGHHGPDEWVSIASLRECRRALCHFVAGLPRWLVSSDAPVATFGEDGVPATGSASTERGTDGATAPSQLGRDGAASDPAVVAGPDLAGTDPRT
jgi:succinyl-diaminopimelate desuccinylase